MTVLEHMLVVLLTVAIIALWLHHRLSEKKYLEIVSLRDAAIDISNHMMDMETSDEGFQYILEKCIELIPHASLGSILMLDEDNNLTAHAHQGFSESHINNFKIPFKDSFVYHKTGGVFEGVTIINDLKAILRKEDHVQTDMEGVYIQSQLTAPLMDGERLIGIVCVDSLKNNVYSQSDKEFLEYMMRHINGITRQQYLRERVVYHSRHDYLTKLYNRSYFEEVIIEQMRSSDEAFILCEIDIDELKLANDIHGHLIGDALIVAFSEAVGSFLKEKEFAGRMGGDEFIICLFEPSLKQAKKRLKTLEDTLLATKIVSPKGALYPQFSYGLVHFPSEGKALDDLLFISDERMYKQKKFKKSNKKV